MSQAVPSIDWRLGVAASLAVAVLTVTGITAAHAEPPSIVAPTNQSRWMSTVPGETLLSELSIPGTHDSMAYQVEDENLDPLIVDFALTQSMPLRDQLRAGIRFFDLRVKWREDVDDFDLYHGGVALGLRLSEALEDMREFLDAHDSEFLLLMIARTDGQNGDGSEQRAKLIALIEELSMQDHFFGYREPAIDDPERTLEDVRGKILLYRNRGFQADWGFSGGQLLAGDPAPWSCRRDYTLGDKFHASKNQLRDTNASTPRSPASEWDTKIKTTNLAMSPTFSTDPGSVCSPYYAAVGRLTDAEVYLEEQYPGIVADRLPLNHATLDRLNAPLRGLKRPARVVAQLGIVIMDFPDRGLIKRIIDYNPRIPRRGGGWMRCPVELWRLDARWTLLRTGTEFVPCKEPDIRPL